MATEYELAKRLGEVEGYQSELIKAIAAIGLEALKRRMWEDKKEIRKTKEYEALKEKLLEMVE